jgi:hypothetical protein
MALPSSSQKAAAKSTTNSTSTAIPQADYSSRCFPVVSVLTYIDCIGLGIFVKGVVCALYVAALVVLCAGIPTGVAKRKV